jgi:hypothetical protein
VLLACASLNFGIRDASGAGLMAKKKIVTVDENTVVEGKTILEWSGEWKPVEGGFGNVGSKLKYKIGVFCAILHDEVVYIGNATSTQTTGLDQRIRQVGHNLTTSNSHPGFKKIRENIDVVQLEVIICDGEYKNRQTINKLRLALKRFYDPAWNRPQEEIVKAVIKRKSK